jgi:hypothetical protein
VNSITTTDLVFNQSQTNSQHYSHPQLPSVVSRQASPEEKDNNNITTTASYGSFHDSPSGLFTTPLADNSLGGSLDGQVMIQIYYPGHRGGIGSCRI